MAPGSTVEDRYAQRGVSSGKEEVHAAISGMDRGLFPKAFCKVVADDLTGSDDHCLVMHADGAGTKSALAWLSPRPATLWSGWKVARLEKARVHAESACNANRKSVNLHSWLVLPRAAGLMMTTSWLRRDKKVERRKKPRERRMQGQSQLQLQLWRLTGAGRMVALTRTNPKLAIGSTALRTLLLLQPPAKA